MSTNKPYLNHLSGPKDLVTTHEEQREGFLALAFEKGNRMTPFINEAKVLKQAVRATKNPRELMQIPSIQRALLKAAGVSEKAEPYLSLNDKENAKKELIKNFLEPAGANFIDELLYRFLLTQGDALGGIMRNIGGLWGKIKFLDMLRAALRNSGLNYEVLLRGDRTWKNNDTESYPSSNLKTIKWIKGSASSSQDDKIRTLVLDINIKIVGKNVDISLFRGTSKNLSDPYYHVPTNFICLGELKGGIDPAGADEHWKTGNSALQRIRDSFDLMGVSPYTFFVGAAIENSMASEIWEQLQKGKLSNVANLTKPSHMEALCLWILDL